MPRRKEDFETGHIYHVFNRCISRCDLFWDDSSFRRMQFTLKYYLGEKISCSISSYWKKTETERNDLRRLMHTNNKRVSILTYVLMPNHYHLLIKQLSDWGISNYIHQVQTSYSHYYNQRQKRYGPIFAGQFKAVVVKSKEQLIHTSRYIHLNPTTAYIVRKTEDLKLFPWSSWLEFMRLPVMFSMTDVKLVLDEFKNLEDYYQFCNAYIDYGRDLKEMKKLMIDV